MAYAMHKRKLTVTHVMMQMGFVVLISMLLLCDDGLVKAFTRPTPSPSPPSYLILFKGGASGLADEGTSLSCLRLAEFKGLASSLAGIPTHQIMFRDALKTDLSVAAGRIITPEEEDDQEEGNGDEEVPGSSLMYVEGIKDVDVLSQIIKRSLLVHATYEVWGVGSNLKECAQNVAALQDTDRRLSPLILESQSWAAKLLVFGEKYGKRKSLKDLSKKVSLDQPSPLPFCFPLLTDD